MQAQGGPRTSIQEQFVPGNAVADGTLDRGKAPFDRGPDRPGWLGDLAGPCCHQPLNAAPSAAAPVDVAKTAPKNGLPAKARVLFALPPLKCYARLVSISSMLSSAGGMLAPCEATLGRAGAGAACGLEIGLGC